MGVITNHFRRLTLSLALMLIAVSATGQAAPRPAIWGIARLTFRVSDFEMARGYYGRFLGFDEAFSFDGKTGKTIAFKVSDRQFLEFVEDPQIKGKDPLKDPLVSLSLETENVEQMRRYLQSNGVSVPEKVGADGAGNDVIQVQDPSGNTIEFLAFNPAGLHRQSRGKFLSERRIARRLHHAGLYTRTIEDDDPFYARLLNCKEILRWPEDKGVPPTILYLGLEGCVENIEHYSPCDRNFVHPCFLVEDMQETIYTLKERRTDETLAKPVIGKGRRWILNLQNPDGTRVEFSEAHTVR